MNFGSARRLLVILACASFPAGAVEVEEGKLSINGFGSWAYGTSTHGNSYDLAQPRGHFDDGDFALSLSARLSEKAVAAAQVHIEGDGTVEIDFVFGEWRFSDLARLRVGLVPHAFGIFGEVPRVGTLRPFFLLPASIYGATDLTSFAVRGANLSGSLPSGAWRVSYDLYGGAIALASANVIDKLTDPGSVTPGGVLVVSLEENKNVLGGRLILNTPVDGLDVRISAYGSPQHGPTTPRLVAGPSLQYLGEKLSVRAEYFFFYEQGSSQPDQQRAHAAYAELAYFVTEQIQLGARAELYQLILPGLARPPYFRHRELAGTFNVWLDPGLVLKLSLHAIDGNRFANPLAFDDALLAGGFARRTLALISGVEFSF
jgi:hypothetical protein